MQPKPHQQTLTALLLVAGLSSRFGAQNKLLANVAGTPMCAHALNMLINSSTDQILVVTGHQHESVKSALVKHCDLASTDDQKQDNQLLNPRVQFAHNPLFESGMASSIVTGITAAADAGAVIVCLGDMPGIDCNVINALHFAWQNNPEYNAFVPEHDGRHGNPVLLTKFYFESLLRLKGDVGARHLLKDNPLTVFPVQVASANIFKDVDNQSDLHDTDSI